MINEWGFTLGIVEAGSGLRPKAPGKLVPGLAVASLCRFRGCIWELGSLQIKISAWKYVSLLEVMCTQILDVSNRWTIGRVREIPGLSKYHRP